MISTETNLKSSLSYERTRRLQRWMAVFNLYYNVKYWWKRCTYILLLFRFIVMKSPRPFLLLLETGNIPSVVCTTKKHICNVDREEPATPTYAEGRPMWYSLPLECLWEKCEVANLMVVFKTFCRRYFSIPALGQDKATTTDRTDQRECLQPTRNHLTSHNYGLYRYLISILTAPNLPWNRHENERQPS